MYPSVVYVYMTTFEDKADALERYISERFGDVTLSIDEDTIEFTVRRSAIRVKGRVRRDLSRIRAAIDANSSSFLGYDVELTATLNGEQR